METKSKPKLKLKTQSKTKLELGFLEKYCKTRKISIEKYKPFLSLIKKLHDKHEASGEKSTMTFWRNVNNLTDMEHYSHSVVNITQSQKIEIIKAGFQALIDGESWITKTKVMSAYKDHPTFKIDRYPYFIEVDNPYYKSSASMKLYLVSMINKLICYQLTDLLVKSYHVDKDSHRLSGLNHDELLQIYNEQNSKLNADKLDEKQKRLERKLAKQSEKDKFFEENIERFLVKRKPSDIRPPRLFDCYLGTTNSGKTHHALEQVKQLLKENPNANIAYLAPLRLLALEIYEKLNSDGIKCSLLTGEEEIHVEDACVKSCTIEMLNEEEHFDLIIIDEYQMYRDEQRGSAWFRAFVNANCSHLILVGSENALFGLVNLMYVLSGYAANNGNNPRLISHYANILPFSPVFKIRQFKRMSSISRTNAVQLKAFQNGDCLVTFSKNKVLQYANILTSLGYSVSILYGDLPMETKMAQSENFKNGLTDVLVTTDVIGMGLNLPIKHLIFETMDKFDGNGVRELTDDEFKQIAGRAGRFDMDGQIAVMSDSGIAYSPYYNSIVLVNGKNNNCHMDDYDFFDYDDYYSSRVYPIKRQIMNGSRMNRLLDEMNNSGLGEALGAVLEQTAYIHSSAVFSTKELFELLFASGNCAYYPFTFGLNISLLEEYKNTFKLGFLTAYNDYAKFAEKYGYLVSFRDNTLKKTLRHFNTIFKKNGFDCATAIGLCQAPINHKLEEDYIDILSDLFDEDGLIRSQEKIDEILINFVNVLYHNSQYPSIYDNSLAEIERLMITIAWLNKRIKGSLVDDGWQTCQTGQMSDSSQTIKTIRCNFAKEYHMKINNLLIAEYLFKKYQKLHHEEYQAFDDKIAALEKSLSERKSLKNRLKKARRRNDMVKIQLYEQELKEWSIQSNVVREQISRLKQEQFELINKLVKAEFDRY